MVLFFCAHGIYADFCETGEFLFYGSHGDFCAAYDRCIHSGGKEKKFHQVESYEEILEFMEGRKIEPMDPGE